MEPSLTVSWLVLLIMIVGLVLYFGSDKPKIAEVGRIMFQIGLFFLCAAFAGTKLFHIP